MELNPASGRSNVVTYQVAAMRPGVVPNDEQWASEVSAERLEKRGELFFGDDASVQAKAEAGKVHAGNERQLMPVEVELHDRCLARHARGAHPRRRRRDAGLVDEGE